MPPQTAGAAPAQDGAAGAALRNGLNWRAVQRSLSDLSDILATSTYTVIYHWDDAGRKWEKQKQEGSLFVVQRSTTTPEYALFMLNRQSVKNVTIPLYPGEMKVTAIDSSMLQVARRGDKIRYGIWFTEGQETVKRFRDTIFRIVGEPTKNTGAARSSPAPAPAARQQAATPAGASTGEDGLSRLFAGLTTVPANAQPAPQSQPQLQPQSQPQQPAQPPQPLQHQAPPPLPHHAQFTSPPQLQQQYSQPPFPSAQGYPPGPPTHHFQPYPAAYAQYSPAPAPGSPAHQQQQQQQHQHQQQPPPPPSAPVISGPAALYRPGETVDDLLKGILGGGLGGPVAPMPSHMSTPHSSSPAPNAPSHASTPPPSSSARDTPLASAAGQAKRSPLPGGASPRSGNRQNGTPSHASPAPPPGPGSVSYSHPLPHSQPQPQPQAHPAAARDALVTTFAPDGSRPPPLGRAELLDTLMRLIQTNEQFGDDVWRAYCARSGQ